LIESNRRLLEQLAQVKRKLDAQQIEIVAGDALAIAAHWPAAGFEIIFLDPPFDSALLEPALAAARRLEGIRRWNQAHKSRQRQV
jgi:16S rRNA G966 N2-methylase RsmD